MKQYEELARVGSKYHKDRNFCGVIALAVATNIKFTKAQGLLRKYGRIKKKGTPFQAFWNSLRDLGFVNVSVWHNTDYDEDKEPMPKTIDTCLRKLPKKGTFWILTNRHITCVKDGVMEDWAAKGSRKRVIWVAQILPLHYSADQAFKP